MTMIFGVPMAVFMGQLTLGLVNGAFYALLSLGLAVIFGLLKIVNFAHGAVHAGSLRRAARLSLPGH